MPRFRRRRSGFSRSRRSYRTVRRNRSRRRSNSRPMRVGWRM